jgi:hypothetical protein
VLSALSQARLNPVWAKAVADGAGSGRRRRETADMESMDARQQQFRERAEPAVREWLDTLARETARLSEFAVDTPLTARPPLSGQQRAVAEALLVTLEVVQRTAQELCQAGDPSWHGWSDAATWLFNDIGRRHLPQLSRVHDEIADRDLDP